MEKTSSRNRSGKRGESKIIEQKKKGVGVATHCLRLREDPPKRSSEGEGKEKKKQLLEEKER